MPGSKTGDKKTVLFLCKCSSNISNIVDFEEIKRWAGEKGDTNIAAVSNLLCAPDGKKFFSEVIKKKNVNNIIIAACSPKLHEKTFQDIAEKNNINMSRVRMANIREQCAWVTADKNEATEKAKSLINAAIKRSFLSEDLKRRTMKAYSDVLIIGGGIAGIETARTISKTGRKVYIVEKNITIGGSVMKTEDLAPSMECSPCLMAPILSDVRDDPNIEVLANAEITNILGFFGNFNVTIKEKPRYVEDNCIACEECFKVCPVSVKNEFHYSLGERKAIYTLFPGAVPASAVIDKNICKHFTDNSCDKCVSVCPFGSINFDQEEKTTAINAGSIVISTGFKPGDLAGFPELGHKSINDVYTTYELESLLSTNGPTGGKLKPDDEKIPASAAIIHCAGSMDSRGIPYCSSICCTHAVKAGEMLGKVYPAIRVFNIHNDLVFTDPEEHQFYKKQKAKGTTFIKCFDLSSIKITKTPDDEKIKISGYGFEPISVDIAVLATGFKPADDFKELAKIMDLALDKNGFFRPGHRILHTTASEQDGIYSAGCASKPVNAAAACTQAQAVAGDIMSRLIPGREIELEIFTSFIDEEKCAGCKMCIPACPFKSIYYDPERKISIINEALCRGCGTCTAACPSGSIFARHYTDNEINAEIEGILHG